DRGVARRPGLPCRRGRLADGRRGQARRGCGRSLWAARRDGVQRRHRRPVLEVAARDDRRGLGRDHGGQPPRRFSLLPARDRRDGGARADRRGTWPRDHHLVAARMIGPPGHLAYAVSKGGLVNMTHQLAVDYARRGVFVNAIAPGKILTGSPEQQNEEALAYSRARTPFPRLGRPEDVAGAAVYLASEDSGYVSGVNLLVDGGWMAY